MERIIIQRKEAPTKPTLGRFLIDGRFHAYSLEDQVRPNGEYVFSKTAIPYGSFEVVVTFSNRFKREMPLIINLQHSSPPILFGNRDIGICGVRIHGGNDEGNTEGCPLMGSKINEAIFRIWDCAKVFDPFLAELKESVKVRKVYLDIVKA